MNDRKWLSDYQGLRDDELIQAFCASSDHQAFGELYRRYRELVFGTCLKYLKHLHDSEDATMAIFEALFFKIREHEISNFKGWLYVTTRNHCLQLLRKGKHNHIVDLQEDLMHNVMDLHPDDMELMEHRENGLRECIARLPKEQKAAVELFYYGSKSYQEIADSLNIEKDIIRSYLQNGRRNLKLCMRKHHVRGDQ